MHPPTHANGGPCGQSLSHTSDATTMWASLRVNTNQPHAPASYGHHTPPIQPTTSPNLPKTPKVPKGGPPEGQPVTTSPPSTVPLVARGPRAWRGGPTQCCLCNICTVQHLIWPTAHWNLPFGPVKATLEPGPAHSALRSHKSARSFPPAPGAKSTCVLWLPPAAGRGAGPHFWSSPACC